MDLQKLKDFRIFREVNRALEGLWTSGDCALSHEVAENMDSSVDVLLNVNGKCMKIKVKTKDSRKQLRIGDFKQFVFQKCRPHFTDELDNYVWKVYDKKLKKYLWANDNVLISDNDKVQASVKEIMTMTVIKPNMSRNGSRESVEKYEVEIADRKAQKKITNSVQSADEKEKPSCSPEATKTKISPAKFFDIKPVLINVFQKYTEEFKWISEQMEESVRSFENESFDGVWNLVAEEVNDQIKFTQYEYIYDEIRDQFGMMLNLYLSILSAKNTKKIEDWQFFNSFHKLDLTMFVKNIDELRNNFDSVSGIHKSI